MKYYLPAAPGRVFSIPWLQGQSAVILSGLWEHYETQTGSLDLVQQSVAEGALFLSPPAVESTGKKNKQKQKLGFLLKVYLILNLKIFK